MPHNAAAQLAALYERYHSPAHLGDDPLIFPRRLTSAADQEIAAFLAAAFAWGNVAAIRGALEDLFKRMGHSPAAFLAEASPSQRRRVLAGVCYRRIHEPDIDYLIGLLAHALRTRGGLAPLWASARRTEDDTTLDTAPRFLSALADAPIARPSARGDGKSGRPLASDAGLAPFGMAVATKASPYKRLHLFLRWVVRPADGLDLGLWQGIESPARLVVPLDVHVLRVAREMGLTARADASARTALEVTAALREVDPADPTRFDFALVRHGMATRSPSPRGG